MFKLTIVNGQGRGTVYNLKDGENVIGRVVGNDIVLTSTRISKRHCALEVDAFGVTMKDLGSSNGTFVNGVLVKSKKLAPGDRVSVGEYVLELSRVEVQKAISVPVDNVVPLRGAPLTPGLVGGMPGGGVVAKPAAAAPQDLKGKLRAAFEKNVINLVYTLNEKHEWSAMLTGMAIALVIVGAGLSVYPVLERVNDKLETETRERALMVARQIVDRNSVYVFEKLDSKTDVGFAEKEKGVLSAYLVDMEGRILAPARKANQYIGETNEAAFSAIARAYFVKHEEKEERWRNFENSVAVAVPLRIFSATAGKNVTVALGLVFYDRSQVLFDSGTVALTYIQSFILLGFVAAIVFFSMYRLTLRPITNLNDEIDQVLKGNGGGATKRYKMAEMNSLIDVVNAALQRIPNSNVGGGAMTGMDSGSVEDMVAPLKFVADRMTDTGMIVVSSEKKVLHINSVMEEITGIRGERAVGDEMSNVARDAAFSSFVDDLVGRAGMGPVSDDFEFSGTAYKMECAGVGSLGAFKAYVITAVKSG